MLITPTGLGWQPAVQPQNRTGSEQAPVAFMPTFQVAATGNTAAQQNSQGSASQQNAEDNRKEAFAKLMVMLQNPDAAARQQASVGKQEESTATQDFHDYMAKSPAEKIKEKFLQEMGLTEEEYNALPPEQKAKIDEQIVRRIQDDVKEKAQAKLEQQALRAQATGNLNSELAATPTRARDAEKLKTAEL
ncbi:hypothetical protein [Pseudomonas entomophila]|uniref:hypothetical protein n=1 Tax=Pseudomonas entomophila TaxID=312306 RepID=UPI001F0327F7|nr:hypothetical protein [Pseudomonas entomophila]MCG8293009.1 hypothetical protein [Pseudomonas entomophila]